MAFAKAISELAEGAAGKPLNGLITKHETHQ